MIQEIRDRFAQSGVRFCLVLRQLRLHPFMHPFHQRLALLLMELQPLFRRHCLFSRLGVVMADFSNLQRDHPTASRGVLPHGPVLHRQGLLIIRGNPRIEACATGAVAGGPGFRIFAIMPTFWSCRLLARNSRTVASAHC